MPRVNDAVARVGELVVGAGGVRWADGRASLDAAGAVFDAVVAEPGLLRTLVEDVAARGATGCESYPCMDKLVLWQSDDAATRLRLHVFSPGYADRPHNHRWSFASRILRGRYVHSVYGSEDDVLAAARSGSPVRPALVHEERAGSQYLLDHSLVHSLHTDEVTVSLLLRGPAVKAEYFTLEGPLAEDASPELVVSTGATLETAEVRASKAMSPERLDHVVAVLGGEGLW